MFFSVVLMFAILACVLTFDLFSHPDRSITFDGRVHITTIAMYHDLLAKQTFPIVWVDHWGNYGFPLGLISYQVTSYLGGLIQFMVGSPDMAYNLLFWLATFFSGILMFYWLRGHVKLPASLLGSVLFVFAPYHIQNMYVRGALPEYVSTVFILLVLLGVQQVLLSSQRWGYYLVIFGVALLSLTHPMMLVTGALFIAPYTLCMALVQKQSLRKILLLVGSSFLGVALASFYIFPLLLELKYFNYGVGDKLRLAGFLNLDQLLSPFAPYFGTSHPGPPGESIRLGVFESLTIAISTVLVLLKSKNLNRFFGVLLLLTLALVSLILPWSTPLFERFSFLNGLQYAWRLLSVITIAIPLLLALLFEAFGNLRLCLFLTIAILASRVPQAYGKDYVLTPTSEYQFTLTNLHTKNMAPIWAGESAEYPPHPEKIGILEGMGTLGQVVIGNNSRQFEVNSSGGLRLIDYTFYFPGWQVRVDGAPVTIEFQDPKFRGVLTYKVPAGKHQVEVRFLPTKIRKLSGIASVAALLLLLATTCFVVFFPRMRKQH